MLIVGSALIVMDRLAIAVPLILSVTSTVKLEVPTVVGVPVIVPVDEVSDSPSGKAPEFIDQA